MRKNKNYFRHTLNKINNKSAIISIIGMGYVGLPLSINFINNKFNVIGIDNDDEKIRKLRNQKSYISSIPNKTIAKLNYTKLESDYVFIKDSDVVIFCLPTPINSKKLPDLRILKKATKTASKFFKKGQLVILESTTYPGCTEELFLPLFQKLNFVIDKNIFLAYSPEREDPGNKEFNLKNTTKVVSGIGQNSLNLVSELYKKSKVKIHKTSNIKTAEMTKLLENTYRNINIGFINEIKKICRSLNINVNNVINSAKTKPFGFTAFYPGPGIGGHCIPVDPHYLLWKLKKIGINSTLLRISSQINDTMPNYIYKESLKIIKKKFHKIKDINILFVGLSYKKNIDDLRESPSLDLIKIFKKNKFRNLFFYDPFYLKIPLTRKVDLQSIRFVEFKKNRLTNFDVIFLLTDHDILNYNLFYKLKSLIFDTRNKLENKNNIYQL
tara:strand:- start:12 stop:1331 length:1320 start_codon:yes stop_codon:yes gene_type:complete